MKPQRFEVGQAVTPNANSTWFDGRTRQKCTGPKFGNVYTVAGYTSDPCQCGAPCILLNEWPHSDWFCDEGFAPVELTTEQITALLEEPQHVEV